MNIENIYTVIKGRWPNQVLLDQSLKKMSYLKTGGTARCLITIFKIAQVEEIVTFLNQNKISYEIIGRGTNVIIKEGIIDKVIIHLKFKDQVRLLGDEIEFPASMPLIKAYKIAYQNKLVGLEFFVGIPGSIGGAVVMNAGIKNQEIKDYLSQVTIFRNNKVRQITTKQLDLNYRSSNIKKEEIILSACFKLNKVGHSELLESKKKSLAYLKQRKKSQPYEKLSVGSTFTNPYPYYSGKLIEENGYKGKKIGGISVSEKHANFLINDGSGNSNQALSLINFLKIEINKKTGIILKEEVKYLGF